MAETEASLLRQFPLFLPQNRAKTVYEGFISAQGRDFQLRILLPEDLQLKNARLLCSWQLRTVLNGYHQIVQQSSLISIHSQFLAALESLKTFWDVMDEIDEKTWVLEPEKPTRSATARRIVLVVKPLGIKLSRNIHLWDPENSLLQNLRDVLEIDFPARAILEKSDFSRDCGICYAYQLDGAIPDQVCDNSQCGQPFHQICLYEWLRGLLTSRQSFNIIFGECPYCSKPITLKMSGRKP
uniref:FA complementation group L n=1 Tax=Equus asinus TaxID=9793 RepID=A0A9L0J8A4_EQUAS